MKKIIIGIVVSSIISMVIFKYTFNNKKTLVVIGDNMCLGITFSNKKQQNYNQLFKEYLLNNNDLKDYNDDYCQSNLSIRKINKYLKDNHKYTNQTILNLLNKADYLTISIGNDELNLYKAVNNTIVNEFLSEFNYLIKTIKKNSNAKIFVIGITTNNNLLRELNRKMSKICQNNNIIFINPNISITDNSFFDIIIDYI